MLLLKIAFKTLSRLKLSFHHVRKWGMLSVARSMKQTSWRAFRRKRSVQKQLFYRLGRIRLWQQIGLFFIFGIVTPLLIIQAWLFHIHDKALQKEFRDLSAQTAVSIFRDFSSILRTEQLLLTDIYKQANRLTPSVTLPYRPIKGFGVGNPSKQPPQPSTPEPSSVPVQESLALMTQEVFSGFVQWHHLPKPPKKLVAASTLHDEFLSDLALQLATQGTQVRDTQTTPFVSLTHPSFLTHAYQSCTQSPYKRVSWQLMPNAFVYPIERMRSRVPLPVWVTTLNPQQLATLKPIQKEGLLQTFRVLQHYPVFQVWQHVTHTSSLAPLEQLVMWAHTLQQLETAQVQTPYLLMRYQRTSGGSQGAGCRITWKPFKFFQPSGVLGTVFRSNIMVFNEEGILMADGTQRHWEGYQLDLNDLSHFFEALPGVPEVISVAVRGDATLPFARHTSSFLPQLSFLNATSSQEDTTETLNDAVMLKLAGDDPWGLLILSPFEISEQYWKRAQRQSTAIFLGQILLAGILVSVYLYSLIRNFQQLIRGIKGVSRGHYSRRVFLMVHPLTPFEIRYLSREFNRMAYRLSLSWKQTRSTLDQLRQMDRFRSDLIDMVSHELRTPLMVLRGCIGAMQRKAKAVPLTTASSEEGLPNVLIPETLQQLTTMKRQVVRLERLVSDLLTVPAIEQGQLTLMKEWVNVAELLQSCVQDVALRHSLDPEQAFCITYDTAETHLPLLWSDPERLEQIFVNLLDNACKYRDTSEAIRITFKVEFGEDTCLRVAMSNLTRTLKPEMAPLLGEKFQRAVIETQRNHLTGSGLGLYICQGLMHLLNGTLERHIEAVSQDTLETSIPLYRFFTTLTFPLTHETFASEDT
ncbi:MAG: ATP-binding protein [Vampirovibrionales bacterium]